MIGKVDLSKIDGLDAPMIKPEDIPDGYQQHWNPMLRTYTVTPKSGSSFADEFDKQRSASLEDRVACMNDLILIHQALPEKIRPYWEYHIQNMYKKKQLFI